MPAEVGAQACGVGLLVAGFEQLTAEVRWAGDLSSNVSAVFGFYAFDQQLKTNPVHSEAVGEHYRKILELR